MFSKFNKISLIISLAFLLSSCHGKIFSNNEAAQKDSDQERGFQTVSEAEASKMNKRAAQRTDEVEVSDRVLFKFDSAELSDEAKSTLDTQVAWLQNDSNIHIIIEGHCDEIGTREYNIALGEKRAAAVKNYLIGKSIAANRMKIISYGKERPAFVGSGEEVWAKNRRAVTVVNQ